MDIKNLTNLTNEILRRLSEWMIKMTKTFSDGSTAVKTVVTDASGNQITSFGSPSTIADYKSPSDFTATYATTSTILLSGYNFQLDTGVQIVYIRQRNMVTNISNVYVNGASGYSFKFDTATSTITLYKDGGLADLLSSNDSYEVGINSSTKAYDIISNSNNTFISNYPVQPIGDVLLNAIVSTTPSAGSNFTVATTVTAAGAVKTAAIAVAGTGYAVSSTLYAYLGGGNNDAIISITTNSSGVPTAITLITGGSGYVASATASTTIVVINYYPSSDGLDIGSYKDLSIHYQTNTATGTVTTAIEASDEDTPTKWYNITKTGYISGGVQANSNGLNSIVNEDGFIDFDNLQRKKIRICSMTTAGTVVPLFYSYQLKGI